MDSSDALQVQIKDWLTNAEFFTYSIHYFSTKASWVETIGKGSHYYGYNGPDSDLDILIIASFPRPVDTIKVINCAKRLFFGKALYDIKDGFKMEYEGNKVDLKFSIFSPGHYFIEPSATRVTFYTVPEWVKIVWILSLLPMNFLIFVYEYFRDMLVSKSLFRYRARYFYEVQMAKESFCRTIGKANPDIVKTTVELKKWRDTSFPDFAEKCSSFSLFLLAIDNKFENNTKQRRITKQKCLKSLSRKFSWVVDGEAWPRHYLEKWEIFNGNQASTFLKNPDSCETFPVNEQFDVILQQQGVVGLVLTVVDRSTWLPIFFRIAETNIVPFPGIALDIASQFSERGCKRTIT